MGSISENKEIVKGYVEAILVKRDFSKFSHFTAPGFYIDRSAVPEAIKGEAGLHTQMDMLYGAFPDLALSMVDIVAEGDKVVVAANFLIDAESNLKAALSGLSAGASQ